VIVCEMCIYRYCQHLTLLLGPEWVTAIGTAYEPHLSSYCPRKAAEYLERLLSSEHCSSFSSTAGSDACVCCSDSLVLSDFISHTELPPCECSWSHSGALGETF
jgi:hypothetical protein